MGRMVKRKQTANQTKNAADSQELGKQLLLSQMPFRSGKGEELFKIDGELTSVANRTKRSVSDLQFQNELFFINSH